MARQVQIELIAQEQQRLRQDDEAAPQPNDAAGASHEIPLVARRGSAAHPAQTLSQYASPSQIHVPAMHAANQSQFSYTLDERGMIDGIGSQEPAMMATIQHDDAINRRNLNRFGAALSARSPSALGQRNHPLVSQEANAAQTIEAVKEASIRDEIARQERMAMSSRLPPLGRNRRVGQNTSHSIATAALDVNEEQFIQEEHKVEDPIEEQRKALEYFQR